jgi:ribosome-binding factor A
MPSHRSLRMAEAIREVVSSTVLFELADPRVRAVTVLGVEVSGDLRSASVSVSIMGSEAEQELAMKGLRHAAGFLQSRVAARLQTRFTPILTFKRDDSVKKSIAIARLIDEALAADAERPAASSSSSAAGHDASAVVDDDDDMAAPPAADQP